MISERRQTSLLANTFFSRMFESELMPPGMPQAQVVISIIAFFGGPSLLLPLLLMKKYVWPLPMDVMRLSMAQDRTLALLLSMTATAFIALAIWENLFPDRRDSRTLGVLPIRARTFVVARLGAIVALFSLLFLLTTALSSISFGVLAAMTHLPEGFVGVAAAHFVATASAEAFVFFGILGAQCALLSIVGPAAAHRLSVVLQVLLIVAVMQMPMVLPPGSSYAINGAGTPGWAETVSAASLPPLWFLSFYQSMIGLPYEGIAHLSRAALLLGTLTPVLALAFYAASYRRLTRLAVEGRPLPRRRLLPRSGGVLAAASRAFGLSGPATAVCAFTIKTLARSRQHRMLLSVWVGVALALTISAAVPIIVRLGWAAFDRPRAPLLVGPLIFGALIQTGMRSLFAIPVDLRANWAFRVREPQRPAEALPGAAAALVICGVLPPAALAFLSATALWGVRIGLEHALFCGMLTLTLVQILMRGIDRMPFTCTYTPGTAQITRLWPLYLTIFSTFTYTAASVETQLLGNSRAVFTAVLVVAVPGVILWLLRLRAERQLLSLRFDAEPSFPTLFSG